VTTIIEIIKSLIIQKQNNNLLNKKEKQKLWGTVVRSVIACITPSAHAQAVHTVCLARI
jgi:hypothetical protein